MLGESFALKLSGIGIAIASALSEFAHNASLSSSSQCHYLERAYTAYEEAFVILTRPPTSDGAWEHLIRSRLRTRLQALASSLPPLLSQGDQLSDDEQRLRAIQVSHQLANLASEIVETLSVSGPDGLMEKKLYDSLEYHHSFWALAAFRKRSGEGNSQAVITAPRRDGIPTGYLDLNDSDLLQTDEAVLLERCGDLCSRNGEVGFV